MSSLAEIQKRKKAGTEKKKSEAERLKADKQKEEVKKKTNELKELKKRKKIEIEIREKNADFRIISYDDVANASQALTEVWATKLGIPWRGLPLKEVKTAVLLKIREIQANKEKKGPSATVRDEEKSKDERLLAIEYYISTYKQDPYRTSPVYGEEGKEFQRIWEDFSREQRSEFIEFYESRKDEFEKLQADKARKDANLARKLHVGYRTKEDDEEEESDDEEDSDPRKGVYKRVNPIELIHEFARLARVAGVRDSSSIVIDYLKLFMANVANPSTELQTKMDELRNDALFPKNFGEQFDRLEKKQQLSFIDFYLNGNRHLDPLTAFEYKFGSREQKQPPPQARDASILLKTGGLRVFKEYANSQTTQGVQTDHKKCVANMKQYNWLIQSPSGEYGTENVENNWVKPNDRFYNDLCQYVSFVKSPKDMIIVINTNRAVNVPVKHASNNKYSPTDLFRDLLSAQKGNIFVKFAPDWILETPVHQLDRNYLNTVAETITTITNMNFPVIFNKLIESSQMESFYTYIGRVVTMFFPLFPNTKKHTFYVAENLKAGLITQEYFYEMSLADKAPEVNHTALSRVLANHTNVFAHEIIKVTDRSIRLNFSPIALDDTILNKNNIDCAESGIKAEDTIILNGKCESISALVKSFLDNKRTNEFTQDVVDEFTRRYSTVFDRIRDDEKKGDINSIEPTVAPVLPAVSRTAWEDIASAEFDEYFNIQNIFIDPESTISNILRIRIEDSACIHCSNKVDSSSTQGLRSMVPRTDGSLVQVSFCTFECMESHKFNRLSSIDEEGGRFSRPSSGSAVFDGV